MLRWLFRNSHLGETFRYLDFGMFKSRKESNSCSCFWKMVPLANFFSLFTPRRSRNMRNSRLEKTKSDVERAAKSGKRIWQLLTLCVKRKIATAISVGVLGASVSLEKNYYASNCKVIWRPFIIDEPSPTIFGHETFDTALATWRFENLYPALILKLQEGDELKIFSV